MFAMSIGQRLASQHLKAMEKLRPWRHVHKQNLFIGAIANMLDVSSSFNPFVQTF